MKSHYGRGPTEAKSYLVDDLLFVVMRGGITEGERTLLDAGQIDTVRSFRQSFENAMAARLTETIEGLTGRRVLTCQSQVLFDPDVVVEIFVFDRPADAESLAETARTVVDGQGNGAA